MGAADPAATLRDLPLAVLGGCTVAVAVALVLVHPAATPGELPEGIRTGVVALELAQSVGEVQAVIGEAGTEEGVALREAYRLGTQLDALFLALYASLWTRLSWVLWRRGLAGRGAAGLAAGAVLVAALCDIAENLALLQILAAPTAQIVNWLPMLAAATWSKWWTLGLAAAALAPSLWRAGAVFIATCAGLLLPGVAVGLFWRGAVDVGALGFAVAVFGVTVLAARPPRQG